MGDFITGDWTNSFVLGYGVGRGAATRSEATIGGSVLGDSEVPTLAVSSSQGVLGLGSVMWTRWRILGNRRTMLPDETIVSG
jgi:hypothetical protein